MRYVSVIVELLFRLLVFWLRVSRERMLGKFMGEVEVVVRGSFGFYFGVIGI